VYAAEACPAGPPVLIGLLNETAEGLLIVTLASEKKFI
jgi:hypothetical protein